MARPGFKVNDEKRNTVRVLAGYGLKHEQIAQMIGIRSPKTLRKYFQGELESGKAEASAQVAQTLYKMATSGTHPVTSKYPNGPVPRVAQASSCAIGSSQRSIIIE